MKRRVLFGRFIGLLCVPVAVASTMPIVRSCGIPWACVDADAYLACSRGIPPTSGTCAREACAPSTDPENPHGACPWMAASKACAPDGACPLDAPGQRHGPKPYACADLLIDPIARIGAHAPQLRLADAPSLEIVPELPAPASVTAGRAIERRARPPNSPWSRRPPARAPPESNA